MVAEVKIEQATIYKLVEVNGEFHKIVAILRTGKDKELVTVVLEDGSVISLPKSELIKVY